MTTATPSLADRFASTLDGMRAAMPAEGTRKGPAAALQAAILRLLEAILALLVQFEAGTLTALPARRAANAAPGAQGAAAGIHAAGARGAGAREFRAPAFPAGRPGDMALLAAGPRAGGCCSGLVAPAAS
jgi:hypothetical protein